MTRNRTFARLAAALAAVLAMNGPVSAAASVTIDSATAQGDVLRVTGSSSYNNQPFVGVGTDVSGDAPAFFPDQGGDVTAAAISATTASALQFRITVSAMPGFVATTPTMLFGWNFCVSGGNCYELIWTRVTLSPPDNVNAPPRWYLYRCGDAACNSANHVAVSNAAAQVFQESKTILMTVPLADIGAAPGSTISGKAVDAKGVVFSALGGPNPTLIQRGSGDGIASVSDYTVVGKTVSLGVAPTGTDPSTVQHTTTALPDADGFWGADVDVRGVNGPRSLFALACLGAGNCATASRDV